MCENLTKRVKAIRSKYTVSNGFTVGYGDERVTYNFRVRWAGSGGYWVSADINDIEILEDQKEV